jgi:hypothetical protein
MHGSREQERRSVIRARLEWQQFHEIMEARGRMKEGGGGEEGMDVYGEDFE